MKILIVAKTDSIHTARWISQIADQDWEIHVFPSIFGGIVHSQLEKVIIHDDFLQFDTKVKIKWSSIIKMATALPDLICCRLNYKKFHALRLARLISRIKPDIVHSLEFQTSGYLVLGVKENYELKFPKWIATNWGSDIYYFARFPEHEKKIRKVLEKCDFYSCECERDIILARQFGFKGTTLSVFPNAGGLDISKISKLRQIGPTSKRRLIMLKGYQGWAGRALIGLEALRSCADLLDNYQVKVYSGSDQSSGVSALVKELKESYKIDIELLPNSTPHEEILKLHGRARTSIGLSMTDGISTSLLETIAMGSFPIQSSTACTDEWLDDGETGIMVSPEDTGLIEKAIRKALTDDKLVNQAAQKNYKTADERLDYSLLKQKTIDFYESVDRAPTINDIGA